MVEAPQPHRTSHTYTWVLHVSVQFESNHLIKQEHWAINNTSYKLFQSQFPVPTGKTHALENKKKIRVLLITFLPLPPLYHSFLYFFLLWWAKPVVHDSSNRLKGKENRRVVSNADEKHCANADQMHAFCYSICSLQHSLFLGGGWWVCLLYDPMKAQRWEQFHFCWGFICYYFCSQTYSAWSKVWVLNVLPETAGRVFMHVSAQLCACVCVQVQANFSLFGRVDVCLQCVSVKKKKEESGKGWWRTEG